MIELADEFDWAFKGVEMAIAMIADMHHAPARGAIPIQHVKFPESEVGVGWPAVGHRIDLRGVPVGLHVLLSAEQKDTKQPCSVLASFLAVVLKRRCKGLTRYQFVAPVMIDVYAEGSIDQDEMAWFLSQKCCFVSMDGLGTRIGPAEFVVLPVVDWEALRMMKGGSGRKPT